jgi:putative polyhydroxyalkanoate system protein
LAEIRIVRKHGLGLPKARQLAFRWAEVAEGKLDLECTYEEGRSEDLVIFRRQGAQGELKVTKDCFELYARLGMVLGVFRQQIETQIVRNLDELLAHEDPLHAFEHRVARHEAKHAPRHAKPHVQEHRPAAKDASAKKPRKS